MLNRLLDGTKKILFIVLLAVLVATAGVIGYTSLDPLLNAPPPITRIGIMCEVADGIAYIKIVQGINNLDAASLYTEIRDLKRMGVKEIHFYINSPGGSLFDAFAIYDAIKKLNEEGIVTVAEAEGWCLSAAVVIVSACTYRIVSQNCKLMVHNPSSSLGSDVVATTTVQYAGLLAENSDLTPEEWEAKMEAGTWFTPEEALEWGLIDEIK